jgi:CheY-like chemotaxis protein
MSTRRFRLLLVEDNPADARLLAEAFGEARIDAEVLTSRNGEEALQLLRSPGFARPDAVILDLNLPRMDGRELLAVIRSDRELSELPVVVLSTSHYDGDVRACQDLHARAYVVKPATFDEAIEVARRIARICQELDDHPPHPRR